MGWQLINSLVKSPDSESYSIGFLKGSDNESGLYCFKQSPYMNKPFISDSFWPRLTVNGSTGYSVSGKTYDNRIVYNSSNYAFIFKPRGNGGNWIQAYFLREPYYYTDIDGTTVRGDYFYEGSFPELNGDAETWNLQGNNEYSRDASISVELKQSMWVWNNNGDRNMNRSGFCGAYLNSEDQTWKFVGVPVFETQVNNNDDYFKNEKFTRSLEKDGGYWGHFTYIGDKGHTITYDTRNAVWCIGTVNSGKWSQSSQEPSTQSSVTFNGFEMDEGSGNPVADPKGDFVLTFSYRDMGDAKRVVNMGEVSLWR